MVLRPKPEKKEEKEKLRLALLHAALHLAAEFGFASLSLREVSREARIAPTSFYRHFEDMEELGQAIINEAVSPMLRGVMDQARTAADKKRAPAAAMVEALFVCVSDDPNLVRFLVAERVGGSASFRAALSDKLESFTRDLERIVLEQHGGVSPASRRPALADAMVTIALEAAFMGLEASAESRAGLAARTLEQVKMLSLGASSMTTRRAGEGHGRK